MNFILKTETLRAELLKCHCVLIDSLASSPCIKDAQEALYLCAEENILLKEVVINPKSMFYVEK